ncbi:MULTISPECIES: hypothetical protein [unclassified Streptomyces]|nr:hypothetical protein [Streptomyces sp. TSRI0281]
MDDSPQPRDTHPVDRRPPLEKLAVQVGSAERGIRSAVNIS